MPRVQTTGDITKNTPGFEFLGQKDAAVGILFSGSTLPTTLEVGMYDDAGTFQAFQNGAITALPFDVTVGAVPKGGVVINVTGGTPDFYATFAGPAGALSSN